MIRARTYLAAAAAALFAAPFAAPSVHAQEWTLLIRNGTIVDGTGAPG